MTHHNTEVQKLEDQLDHLYLAYNILGAVLYARGYREANPKDSYVLEDWVAREEEYNEYDALDPSGQDNILTSWHTLTIVVSRSLTMYEGWCDNSEYRDTTNDFSFCITQWSK